jgi:hypothetical protein
MKRKTKTIIGILTVVLFAIMLLCTACRESERVGYNISQQADNFNVVRRITVFNCRSDTVLFQLTGTFSLQNSGKNELEVICELPDHTYTKHFIYLNEWVTYTVEDMSGTHVSKYSYELNFLPDMIPGVKITSND